MSAEFWEGTPQCPVCDWELRYWTEEIEVCDGAISCARCGWHEYATAETEGAVLERLEMAVHRAQTHVPEEVTDEV